MAVRFYDEAIYKKIQSWIVDPKMRILKPDEVTRLFQTEAYLNNDAPIKLPLIAISRDPNINVDVTTKRNFTYDGKHVIETSEKTAQVNLIPITVNYQLDIYTFKYEEGDEYLRNFIFQLINHPKLEVEIPYNGIKLKFNSNIRLNQTVTDTSDIPNRLFEGQFTRWTILLTLQDAYLFNTSISDNYKFDFNSTGLEIIESKIDENNEFSHNGFTHISEEEK